MANIGFSKVQALTGTLEPDHVYFVSATGSATFLMYVTDSTGQSRLLVDSGNLQDIDQTLSGVRRVFLNGKRLIIQDADGNQISFNSAGEIVAKKVVATSAVVTAVEATSVKTSGLEAETTKLNGVDYSWPSALTAGVFSVSASGEITLVSVPRVIESSVVWSVPADYATLDEAMVEANKYLFSGDGYLTIAMEDGDHTLDDWPCHPHSGRISVVAASGDVTVPDQTAFDGVEANDLAALQAAYPCRLTINSRLDQDNGGLPNFNNILFLAGSATRGVYVRGGRMPTFVRCSWHGFSSNAIYAYSGSFYFVDGVMSHCGSIPLFAEKGGNISCGTKCIITGGVTAVYALDGGVISLVGLDVRYSTGARAVFALNGATVRIPGATIQDNAGYGIQAQYGSMVSAQSSTIKDNGTIGAYAFLGSVLDLFGVDVSGHSVIGVYCFGGSTAYCHSASASEPTGFFATRQAFIRTSNTHVGTTSPAYGVEGNLNSIIN